MKFLAFISKLVIAYYLGRYVADQILIKNHLFVIALYIGFLYSFFLSWDKKFLLYVPVIFFPISFPHSPLPINYMREIISPILCFFLLTELLSDKQPLFSRRVWIFFLALGVLALWSIVNYIKRPVLGQLTFGVTMEGGGLQDYYIIFAGITTFLCSFWFFKYKGFKVNRFLLILLLLSIIAGDLQVIGFFTGFSLPFFGGAFGGGGAWFESVWAVNFERDIYYAIGGLKQASMVGFSALIALLYKRRLNLFYFFCFINFLILIILSGGRAPFFGIVFAIIMYASLINRRLFIPLISAFLLIISIYMIFFPGADISQSKFGRLGALSGGLKEQSTDRFYSFLYMLEIFKKSPVFGKGIGYQKVTDEEFFKKYPEAGKFRMSIEEMTMSGSHGSYTSILSTFGIGGIFWFITMLWGSIYYAYRFLRRSDYIDESKLAVFTYILLSILSVHLLVGGAGYDVFDLWFLAGMIAGLKVKKEERGVVDATDKQDKFQGERLLWAED